MTKQTAGRSAKRGLLKGLAVMGTVTAPLLGGTTYAEDATAVLVARAAEKNAAFMNGDMQRWLELVRIAPDFTLMEPFGGPASHGFDARPERMAKRAQYFQGAETALELAQTYTTDSMIVLVMIERQRGKVGGLPEQDWSLRVTEVYRKDGADWSLVHRHADPLVDRIPIRKAALIADGPRKKD